MNDTPTPGQICYEAYMVAVGNPWYVPAFHRRCAVEQAAWDAAAQAVREDTPRWQFALGQHVRRTSDPALRWEIWYRACREEHDRTLDRVQGKLWIDYGVRLVDPEATYHPCRMSDGTDLTPAEDAP
jgi:hypothetical protein